MFNLRIGSIGLASAVAGFLVQGCFAAQPIPECQVPTAEAYFGLTPYYVKLSNPSDACSTADHMYLGTQRFRIPDSNDYRLGYRSSVLMDYALGYNEEANLDPSNDCSLEEFCETCVVNVDDGGIELGADGGVVQEFALADGGSEFGVDDGMGGYEVVDVTNECVAVLEPVERFDPADPDGANLVGYATMPRYPTNGVCSATGFSGSSQSFQAETEVDGTVLPALPVSVAWSELDIFITAKVPGTAFKGKVTITEGTCTSTFDALAFWPAISCTTDADCDPVADLDAGRPLGSGINPLFEPKCNTALEICEPGVDVSTLR